MDAIQTVNPRERAIQETQEGLRERFKESYGIDSGSAAILFANSSHLKTLLEHMYFETMEELRECTLKEDGERIQGQAQLLWSLLNLPEEIRKIENTE